MRAISKTIYTAVAAIALMFSCAAANSQTAPFTIQVTTTAAAFAPGEDIVLTIRLENISGKLIYWRGTLLPGYFVDVKTRDGIGVDLTAIGKRRMGDDPNHPLGIMNAGRKSWPTGKVRTYEYKLNEWYDVGTPGTYVVTISAWDLEKPELLHSEPLVIAVR